MREKILLSLIFSILLVVTIPATAEIVQPHEGNSKTNLVRSFSSANVDSSSDSDSTILSFGSTILSFSSSTWVNSITKTTTTNTAVTLDFFETNDGTVPLTSPMVISDNSLCNPVFVEGDKNNDDILDPSEQWHYTCKVISSDSGIFEIVLTGFGTAPDSTVITWPEDPEERIIGTIKVEPSELFCGLPITEYNVIDGTPRNDKIKGTSGNDLIRGFEGHDKIYGKNGNDCLLGGDGNDRLYGNSGNDIISGGEGNDKLFGKNGEDILNGDEGNDKLYGNNGEDTLDGGDGKDRCNGGKGDDTKINCEK